MELVLAKIYDIDDEEIQKEYMDAFNQVVKIYDQLKNDYDLIGYSQVSEELILNYNIAFRSFESELNLKKFSFLNSITGISYAFLLINLIFLILNFSYN